MIVLDFLLASSNWFIPIEIYNRDHTQCIPYSSITDYMGAGDKKRTQYKKVSRFLFVDKKLKITTKARKI